MLTACYTRRGVRCLHVLFFGTDHVSLATLRALHAAGAPGQHPSLVSSITVVCPGARPAGRGQRLQRVPVHDFALQHGLDTIEVPYEVKKLGAFPPPVRLTQRAPPLDVGVVVSFGYFITPAWTQLLPRGAINMHPSLLPKYRGSAPIPRALLAGETITGVSVIDIHPTRFDAGACLSQQTVHIEADETASRLTERLADIGAAAVLRALRDIQAGAATRQPQLDGHATPAPKLQRTDGAICWEPAPSVASIMRQYCGMDGSYGVYCGVRLPAAPADTPALQVHMRQLQRTAADLPSEAAPGTLLFHRPLKALFVRCRDGWIEIRRIQVDKRKEVTGYDFAQGYHLPPFRPGEHLVAEQARMESAVAAGGRQ